ncbi:hypothetical protein F4778DRAFT_796438 [Xylariomycetidae sp. FL2044]|nr:hypothetical protein F4778DRAFT_796438 [Xylariomycetidae sp. FL2044]
MSGVAESAKSQAGNTSPEVRKQSGAPSHPSAPRSMPDTSRSESQVEESGEGEGEMVPAAGRINENGEVIDDDGNPIGKVTDGDAQKFIGFIVTQEGDILNDDGGVVGKAEPLEDVASELNYTTKSGRGTAQQSQPQQQEGEQQEGEQQKEEGGSRFGGVGKALGGIGNTAGSAFSGVTGGLGKTTKGATDAAGDATKGATDTVGEATGTQDVTGAVGDNVKGATDTAGDAAEGATGAVGDTAEGATGAVGDTAEGAADTAGQATEGATGAAEGATEGVPGAEGATQGVKDTAEGAQDTAEGAVEGAQDTAEGVPGDAQEAVDGAKSDVQETGDQAAPIDIKDMADEAGSEPDLGSKAGSKPDLGSKAGGLAEQAPVPELPTLSPSVANKVVALFEGPFTVADGGKVTDQNGNVLGKLAEGSDIQDLVGKQCNGIDGEGNLLGENDTIIGKVDIAPEGSIAEKVKEQVPEAADHLNALDEAKQAAPLQIPSFAPSVADKVIAMFEGPFNIAENGQVTDQNGKVLGKLTGDQDYEHLLGKDIKGIDGQGNLLGDNDTVLGKVDLAPEGTIVERIMDEVPEAGHRLDALDQAKQQAPEAPASIKIPSFSPSVAGKVLEMFQEPFNVGENGKVTDQNGKVLGKLAEGQDFDNLVGKDIKNIDPEGNLLGDNGTVLGKIDIAPEGTSIVERIKDQVPEAADKLDAAKAKAEEKTEEAGEEAELPPIFILEGLKINKAGNVVDEKGNPLGRVKSGDIKKMVGRMPDREGKVWDDRGQMLGEVEVLPEAIQNESSPFEDFPDATVDKFGKVIFDGRQVGVVVGDDWQKLIGKKVDADGDILDKNGNTIGHAERAEAEEPDEPEEEQIDYSGLVGKKVNKMGNVVDDKGQVWGHVVQGILKNLVGKKVGENGEIFNDAGKVVGKAEPIPESEMEEVKEPAPFEDFPDNIIADEGKVMYNDEQIGIVVEGDHKKLKGKTVDPDGDILDRNGNSLGRAERWEAEAPEPEPEIDMSILAGKRINKAGNAVDKHGDIYGRVVEGDIKRLVDKMCDKNGCIRNEAGDVIGKCELIPEAERDGMKEGPFTELPGCTVAKDGTIVTPGGDIVGRLVSGDPKVLFGRAVDDDGDILDKNGNALGHAERWEPEETPKEVSPMSGRRVNREGNVVDENGDVIGKLTTGELSQCAGKKIDDDADVVDPKGNKLGHCSLLEEIPAPVDVNPMSGRRVNREGNVVDENGDLMGKLTSGELSQCAGKKIDDDGDVVDQKGAKVGHVSLLEEIPEKEDVNPMSGRQVNYEGNVVDENGNLMGKLTTGELSQCVGKKIDDDGDVVDKKGNVLGHCSLLQEIQEEPEPEPEPEETEEEREARLQLEQDRKIAGQIAWCIEGSLDKIKPLCRMMVDKIDAEERKPEDERDEEELVKQVRPLIEEASKILTEANGVIRGLDPGGRISANAKAKSAGREATPEEYHLAELLKELTGTVTETIENCKRKLENLPKAKKGINPLWGLLSEPLFQILAGVGMLLAGVLGLVGKLLNGLGLGGLVNNLLGGLGLGKLLDGLGLGSILGPLTGKKK